jgi:NAD+ diphosphatase
MNFIASSILPLSIDENSLWFIFKKDDLLIINNNERIEPLLKSDLNEINMIISDPHYLGTLDGRQCFTAELKSETIIPANTSLRSLRTLLTVFDEIMFTLAGKAFQVIEWDRNHKFCGRCGTKTETKNGERAKVCPNCGLVSYPRISPAVIVAVIKENKILLARATRFKTKMYSVLAGFVEPGETFEECVQREIFEEVSIKVKNIKYFGSQPWPFPDSVMIGFTAEYESGEIIADHEEIMEAGWYSPDELPEVPLPGRWSIAKKLIDWYLEKYRNK